MFYFIKPKLKRMRPFLLKKAYCPRPPATLFCRRGLKNFQCLQKGGDLHFLNF